MQDGIAGQPPGGFLDGTETPLPLPPLGAWLRAWIRYAAIAFAVSAGLWIAATAMRFYVRDYYVFLPDYIRWLFAPAPASSAVLTHVFVLRADHFEPWYDPGLTAEWLSRYRQTAARHRDADGRPPQETWFYPGEQESEQILGELGEMTAAGFGEVELHFHHDHDTYESLKPRLARAIATFQSHGFLRTTDGRTAFAFVHGNSGLDNGDGPEMCGVNEELRLLRELGAFADFTFPSLYEPAQPPFVNAIYAAKDDPEPRSYRHRLPLSALTSGRADLMMFEGPLLLAPSLSLRHLFIDVEDGDIHGAIPASPERVDRWIDADVHVPGRPDWIFVKLFTHGVSTPEDEDAAVGASYDEALAYLERTYNDGRRYSLHYITAREAYNLAMAAAAHVSGPPEQYYDYLVKPYLADHQSTKPASVAQ